jgi:prephenate dehydrogenase
MWRDVLLANREQVLAQSRAFRAALLEMENAMAEGESQALEQSIARARRVRAAWQPGASSSPDSQQDA